MTEDDCRAALESIRWPEGPVCPHCSSERFAVSAIGGTSHRQGLYLCASCRRQFTVTVGTPLKGTKLPLKSWIEAAHMLNASELSTARQVEQTLGVPYKTAWRMVNTLLDSVKDYKGRLRVDGSGAATFGGTVSAYIEPLLPKDRNTQAAYRRKQLKIARGTYKAPREPEAHGVLRPLLCPPATKAHADRTERFLQWVITGGLAEKTPKRPSDA